MLAAATPTDAAASAQWKVGVDHRGGLPHISRGGAEALASAFAFWSADWRWAGVTTTVHSVAPDEIVLSGTNQALEFNLEGRVRKTSSRQAVWRIDIDAKRAVPNVIGGGVSFKFNLSAFGSAMGAPALLRGNRGWTWGPEGGSRAELRFDPPVASVYFERGQKSEIRAFFFDGDIPRGRRVYTATLTVGGGMTMTPDFAKRDEPADRRGWMVNLLDGATPPVDLSFLNASDRPAGKRGFVKAVGDKLKFADGTTARFWGTNLTANALFGTTRENVEREAHRLSALGFNLVRFHHHDAAWVTPNVFGNARLPDTGSLDAAMLDKLDWWIKCLKSEGIYVWLDLHVGRQLKRGDGIEGFDEISKDGRSAELKGYNYVNRTIEGAMKRFDQQYVTHVNPYTGLRYKDDPAIVTVLLTNENDVTNHYANALLPNKGVPWHSAAYMRQAARFAASWGLPEQKTWSAWEPGASKLFLNDLERRFDVDMIGHLRSLGVKVPIVTTSTWGSNPLASLPALTSGDMIDVHAYGGKGELRKDPEYASNIVDWIAAGQVVGKPLSASEWNVEPFPVEDRCTIPLYVAASAAFQGWDAVVQYAYSQNPLNRAVAMGNWEAHNDAALLAALPAAALLYRREDVRQARAIYAFAFSEGQIFDQAISPENSIALRTATERGKVVIALPHTRELPWLAKRAIPAGAIVVTDPNRAFIDRDADEVSSDTGELRRNWKQGTFTISTPRTQAAMGRIGGGRVRLPDVEIEVSTRDATVAVQSLDGRPIRHSRNLLISVGARSGPYPGTRFPVYSEPVEGRLTIAAPAGLALRVADAGSEKLLDASVTYRAGKYYIALERSQRTYWLILGDAATASPARVPRRGLATDSRHTFRGDAPH